MVDGEVCPFCASTNVEVPVVDIGVGYQKCGPSTCLDCLAYEEFPGADMSDADEVERRFWWRRGPNRE